MEDKVEFVSRQTVACSHKTLHVFITNAESTCGVSISPVVTMYWMLKIHGTIAPDPSLAVEISGFEPVQETAELMLGRTL